MQATIERVSYFIFLVLCFALYPYLNRHPGNAAITRVVKFWVDDYLPIVPVFVVPYLLFLPFLFGTIVYFVFFTKRHRAATYALSFCQLAACLCFVLLETKIVRPEIVSNDVFSSVLRTIYANDQPYNCLPSTHVSLSIVCGWLWVQIFPHIKCTMSVFVLLICASTVLLKQHYLPDVLTGIILAIASIYVGNKLESRTERR
jgi:membrane-associated phospholipid phosphatase